MMKYLRQSIKIIFCTALLCSVIPDSYAALASNGVDVKLQNAIDKSLEAHQSKQAGLLIDQGLVRYPNNPSLLLQKASLQVDLEKYRAANVTLQELKATHPYYPKANKLIQIVNKEIASQPKNEIGLDQDNIYVDDLHSIWNFTSLHYYRLMDSGKYGARVNYVHRYGSTAFQYMLEAYPQLTSYMSLAMSYGYANNTQQLLPTRQYYIEPFFELPHGVETSLGMRGVKVLSQNIYTYTGSVGKYLGDYFVWVRPSHYTPNATNYTELGLTKFFDGKGNYIYGKIGAGRAPDIADFAPLNQVISTSNRAVYLGGQREVAKNLYVKLQGGYIWQAFPSDLIRRMYDGYLGVTWQF